MALDPVCGGARLARVFTGLVELIQADRKDHDRERQNNCSVKQP